MFWLCFLETESWRKIYWNFFSIMGPWTLLYFSPFLPHIQNCAQNYSRENKCNSNMPRLARSSVVCRSPQTGQRASSVPQKKVQSTSSSSRPQRGSNKQNPIGGLPLLVRKMENERLSREVMEFLQFTWRESTRKVYSSYLRKWATFCLEHNYDMYELDNSIIMDFLFGLIKKCLSYSAVYIQLVVHYLQCYHWEKAGRLAAMNVCVCWLKALGNFNPPKPRYSKVWEINLVLNLFKRWGHKSLLSTYHLTLKVTVLLLLLTAPRGQTIWRLNVTGLEMFEDHMSFKLKHLLKHNRPGEPLDTLIVPSRCFSVSSQSCESLSILDITYSQTWGPIITNYKGSVFHRITWYHIQMD